MARILVIEDDIQTSADIAACLSACGFQVEQRFDGQRGLDAALTDRFDAITLDRMLPSCDGLYVVKTLRERGVTTPVLMLSAMGEVDERVAGLRGGGDDYLVKPFAPDELAVRIELLIRHHKQAADADLVLRVGDLELDLVTRTAKRLGHSIELLPMEFRLLEFLMQNAGQMLSRQVIFEHVWEYHFDPGTNLIDVHIGRLRKKIDAPGAPSLIKTERRKGYSINAL